MATPEQAGDAGTVRRWRAWVAPALVLALAATLRLSSLGHDGMWSDECLTADWVGLPWRGTLAAAASDNNAPLYFLLAKLPAAALVSSEAAWRLLPALLGLASVLAMLAVGTRLLSQRAGVAAAFLLAISPLHVHYSREARNYTLLILMVLLAFAAAGRVRRRGRPGDIVTLALLLASALYTHALAALAAAGILVAWGLFPFERRAAIRLLAAAALAAALFAPWLPGVLRQGGRSAESYAWHAADFDREFPWQPLRSLAALSHGSLAPVRNRVADLLPQAWVGAGLVALLAALGVARRRRLANPDVPLRLLVATWLPLVALFAVAALGPPIYVVGRADVIALPFLLLSLAAGVAALPAAAQALAAVALSGLAILPLQVLFRLDTRSQEKVIAGMLGELRRPGEPVIATTMLPCLQFYGRLRPGDELIAFPARPAATADWVDWRAHPSRSWPSEAAALVRRIGERAGSPSAARAFVILGPDAVGGSLAGAFDRALPRLGDLDLGYRGLRLRVYALPQPRPER